MHGFSFSIWVVFIIVGAAQAFFLFGTLFSNRHNKTPNRLPGLLLFVIAIHLVELATAVTGLSLRFPHVTASRYPLLYSMGPLFFLYTQATLYREFHFKRVHLLHFILGVICLLILLPFYGLSKQEKIAYIGPGAKRRNKSSGITTCFYAGSYYANG